MNKINYSNLASTPIDLRISVWTLATASVEASNFAHSSFVKLGLNGRYSYPFSPIITGIDT
nr:hypothetical protein [Mycoplasmopsis agalactiae]